MSNIKVKAGQMPVGAALSWLAVSFLACATAGWRGEEHLTGTLLQIAFFFSLLLAAEAYSSMLLNPQWTRVSLGMVLLLYLMWFVGETLF